LTQWYDHLWRIGSVFVLLWPSWCTRSCSSSFVDVQTTQCPLSTSDMFPEYRRTFVVDSLNS